MLSGRQFVALGLLVIAVCYAAFLRTRTLEPAFRQARSQKQGMMRTGGEYPGGETLRFGKRLRHWASWSGSDENVGAVRVGPFPAPEVIRFAVSGHPTKEGARVFVELAATGEQLAMGAPDVGAGWKLHEQHLPTSWEGHEVFLCAEDSARDWRKWIGISEPMKRPLWGASPAIPEALTSWAVNGLLLACMFLSAAHWLRMVPVPPESRALLASAAIALLAYAVFWIFFISDIVGHMAVYALLAASVFTVCTFSKEKLSGSADWPLCKMLLAISFFYMAVLYLYWTPRDFYDLAANRFNEYLPADNYLPWVVARLLTEGQSLNAWTYVNEWLVSDRPPLQTGWILLTFRLGDLLGLNERTFSGTSTLWFQTIWIFGLYALLRTLRLDAFRAMAWIAVMALNGFFVQHTTFTWPKMSTATFACGAFLFWFLPLGRARTPLDFLIGAVLAALGWLSHSGVTFAYIPLAFLVLWRFLLGERRPWVYAAIAFMVLVAPWLWFQKYYNPPANRLLKWHFAGQMAIDPRGTSETIRDAYREKSTTELVSARVENLKTQFGDRWASHFELGQTAAPERRHAEFHSLGRALNWWLLGLVLLPLSLIWRRKQAADRADSYRNDMALAAWLLSTLFIWCLLMFQSGKAWIHQGSYTVPFLAFALLAALLDRAGKWTLPLLALLQVASFVTTWLVRNAELRGASVGWPLLVFGALGVGAALFTQPRTQTASAIESSR